MGKGHMGKKKVRTAIIGVGNCASALVQGVEYYKKASAEQQIPGLMNPVVGGYHISDIEFSAAIDINVTKVGKDLSQEFPHLGQSALYCVSEVHTQADIDRLTAAIEEVVQS